ncbi:hypothetical protein [Crossiella sp. CA198]|uniref:hypothetical protein n=1 Tax=Crossiella sp. CA198 TaxID=3455607 RepID=UPI003F8D268B
MSRREARSAAVRAAVRAQPAVTWAVVETCPAENLRDADGMPTPDITTAGYGGYIQREQLPQFRDAVFDHLVAHADYAVHGRVETCSVRDGRVFVGWEWDDAPTPTERAQVEAAEREALRAERRAALQLGAARRRAREELGG